MENKNVIDFPVYAEHNALWGCGAHGHITAFIDRTWAEKNGALDVRTVSEATILAERAARHGALITWEIDNHGALDIRRAKDLVEQHEALRRINVIHGACSAEEENELGDAAKYYMKAVKSHLPKTSLIGKENLRDVGAEMLHFTAEVDRAVVMEMKRARFPLSIIESAVLQCSPRREAVASYYQNVKKGKIKTCTIQEKQGRSAFLSR